MLAALLARVGGGGRGGAIPTGQEEGGTLHSQEALTDSAVGRSANVSVKVLGGW